MVSIIVVRSVGISSQTLAYHARLLSVFCIYGNAAFSVSPSFMSSRSLERAISILFSSSIKIVQRVQVMSDSKILLTLLIVKIMRGLPVYIFFLFLSCTKKEVAEMPHEENTVIQSIVDEIKIDSVVTPTIVVGLDIGNKAPALSLLDTNDIKISLSDIKGKLILIDFWASRCKPCRMENKKLIDIYTRYKDTSFKSGSKGFEIFSVSIDQRKIGWIRQILYDKYNWKFHVKDDSIQNTAAILYKVTSIPKKFSDRSKRNNYCARSSGCNGRKNPHKTSKLI